jgi:hypothetical protein
MFGTAPSGVSPEKLGLFWRNHTPKRLKMFGRAPPQNSEREPGRNHAKHTLSVHSFLKKLSLIKYNIRVYVFKSVIRKEYFIINLYY